MQISRSIYWVSGAAYRRLGSVFAIRHSEGLALIDCGEDQRAYDTIHENLRLWGLDHLKITHLLLTHCHRDHAGAARLFRDQGATVVAGAKDAEVVEAGGQDPLSYPFAEQFPACPVDIKITEDQKLPVGDLTINILTMPGHTGGSLFFEITIDEKNVLFTGDMLQVMGNEGEAPEIGWKGSPDYDPKQYIQSIARAYRLNPDWVIGGHGVPLLRDAPSILKAMYKKVLEQLR